MGTTNGKVPSYKLEITVTIGKYVDGECYSSSRVFEVEENREIKGFRTWEEVALMWQHIMEGLRKEIPAQVAAQELASKCPTAEEE